MPTVNIPSIGVIHFPDEMTPAEIQVALRQIIPPTGEVRAEPGFLGRVFERAGLPAPSNVGTPSIGQQPGEPGTPPGGVGATRLLGGVASLPFAAAGETAATAAEQLPIEAQRRLGLEAPVLPPTLRPGLERFAPKGAGELGEAASTFFPLGRVTSFFSKGAQLTKEGQVALERATSVARSPQEAAQIGIEILKDPALEITRQPLMTAAEAGMARRRLTPEIPEQVATKVTGRALTTTLSPEAMGRVVQISGDFMKEAGVLRQPNVPVTMQMGQFIIDHPSLWKNIEARLTLSDVSVDDFVKLLYATSSDDMRVGQRLSALSRSMQQAPELSSLASAIERQQAPLTGLELAGHFYTRAINMWRGLLTPALSTAVRNEAVSLARYPLLAAERSVDGAIRSIFQLGPESERGIGIGFQNLWESLQTLVSSGRRIEAMDILKAFPEEYNRLFMRFGSDILARGTQTGRQLSPFASQIERGFNKVEQGVNFANVFIRAQDFINYKITFRVKLMELLRAKGITSFENLSPASIDINDITKAVDHALEMSFAATPSNAMAKWFLDIYKNPVGKTLSFVIPFPRFMTNAWRFLYEHSPLSLPQSLYQILSPAERAGIAAGNPTMLGKTVTGSGLLLASWALRNSPSLAGEKWYQIHLGQDSPTTVIRGDLRPYNPMTSYLWITELFKRVFDGTLLGHERDLISGLTSSSFRGGAGSEIMDTVRGLIESVTGAGDPEKATRKIREFAGAILGGASQPFVTLRELFAQYGQYVGPQGFRLTAQEEAKFRDIKSSPLTGPFMAKVPLLSQLLPEKELPLREANPTLQEGTNLSRQFTGLSTSRINVPEQEASRLGLLTTEIRGQGVGEPTLNLSLIRALGPIAERAMTSLIANPQYQKLGDTERRVVFTKAMEELRRETKKNVIQQNPEAFLIPLLKERLSPRERELLIQRGKIPPEAR